FSYDHLMAAPQTLRIARAAARRALVADLVVLGGWALLIGAVGAALLVGADRVTGGALQNLINMGWPWAWLAVLIGAPIVLAMLGATILALVRRWTPMHAAVELDRRLGLKDTLATGLSLANGDRSRGGDGFASW